VRVLEIGNFSKELCGGTHVGRTSEIGLLKIVSEGSVGANLRRIEAVTSFDAMESVYAEEDILRRAAETLKCRPAEVAEKADALTRRLKDAEKAARTAGRASGAAEVDALASAALDAGYPVVVARVATGDAGALRELSDALRGRLPGGAVVLAAESDGKALLLAAGSDAAVAAGFDAGKVIRTIAPAVGGGGGGKPQMAQAGGKDPAGIDEALRIARETLGVA
jgi:alanyl-tRNA synthetase